MGVVTAHIVEEGTDVRVSFSGTLLLDPTLISGNIADNNDRINVGLGGSGIVFLTPGPFLGNMFSGNSISSSLAFIDSNYSPSAFTSFGPTSFGFVFNTLFWEESSITGGVTGAVSEITVDPSESFFVIGNTRLADVLGGTTGDGDTLWTATTNDTIVLSTSAPVIVPEPSSAIFCFFAGIGLLRRKR